MFRLAHKTANLKASALREILKITQRPNVISFAGGLPASELFPIKEIQRFYNKVFDAEEREALQYSVTEGYQPLREFLADHLKKTQNIVAASGNIIITSGSQQGIYLLGKIFLDPGDYVILGRPTYMAAVKVFEDFQANMLCVDVDEEGERVEQIEKIMQQHSRSSGAPVRFFYTVPTFQNPTGVTMSESRRKRLLKISASYNLPIVEDNPYGEISFIGNVPPTLKSQDRDGRVIYLGSFSKISFPGLRLGWVCADEGVITPLIYARQSIDLHSNSLAQRVMFDFCKSGELEKNISRIRDLYKKRRDVMMKSMEKFFPKEITWTCPMGGMFIWITLPENGDSRLLLERAVEDYEVAFVPGFPFYPTDPRYNTLRLSYVTMQEDRIIEGIRRLGELFYSMR